MNGLSTFEPGGELHCHKCPFRTGAEPKFGCRVATEMADAGEAMMPECCAAAAGVVLLHEMGGAW